MMDFARRLAPVRDSDATRADAVLPSRFGGESPLRAPPTASVDDAGSPPSTGTTGLDAGTTPQVDALRGLSIDAVSARAAPSTAATTAAGMRSRDSTNATTHTTDRRDAVAAMPMHVGVASPLDGAARAPHERDASSLAADGRSTLKVSVPSPMQPAPTAVASRSDLLRPATRSPMSDAALAARSAQSAEPRPVVHVTIDRIEVRAPAASPRPVLTPRARSAAPSVSLGDYLRQRSAKPGGNA